MRGTRPRGGKALAPLLTECEGRRRDARGLLSNLLPRLADVLVSNRVRSPTRAIEYVPSIRKRVLSNILRSSFFSTLCFTLYSSLTLTICDTSFRPPPVEILIKVVYTR